MSVILRQKKLKRGKVSLYLDIYDGIRRYTEFLNIKIVPNDRDKKIKMEIAETRRAQKEIELLTEINGIQTKSMKQIDFISFFQSKCTYHVHENALKYLKMFVKDKYSTETYSIQKIDKIFIENYIKYMHNRLKPNTVHLYFSVIRSMLNHALKENIIQKNPSKFVKSSIQDVEKVFLSEEELLKLSKTECPKNEDLKKAFLLSCLTGLRLSDVVNLKYSNIINGMIQVIQKKTKNIIYVPLNNSAMNIIQNQKKSKKFESDSNVFKLYKAQCNNNKILREWAESAGIKKHISYHTSRHTFAVLMLSKNVNVYTVSKLMGHKNLRTTEIYAKIVDQTKIDAVNSLPQLNI